MGMLFPTTRTASQVPNKTFGKRSDSQNRYPADIGIHTTWPEQGCTHVWVLTTILPSSVLQ